MKKFLMVLVTCIGCIFLAACFKEEPQIVTVEEPTTQKEITMEDVFSKINEQEWNTVNLKYNWGRDEEYIKLQILIKCLGERRAAAWITASFRYGEYQGNPMHFTTVFYDNGDFYLNQKEICDYILASDEQYIMITGFFKALKEYIFIQKEDIGVLMEEWGMEQEKEILFSCLDMPVKKMFEEAETFFTAFQEQSRMFELTEETAVLQMEPENRMEINRFLEDWNVQNSFLENMDSGRLEFGVAKKDKLYLQAECERTSAEEKFYLSVDFTKEEPEQIAFPESSTSFADFMKVYNRIKKLFGKLS